jgi:hypothetical protein
MVGCRSWAITRRPFAGPAAQDVVRVAPSSGAPKVKTTASPASAGRSLRASASSPDLEPPGCEVKSEPVKCLNEYPEPVGAGSRLNWPYLTIGPLLWESLVAGPEHQRPKGPEIDKQVLQEKSRGPEGGRSFSRKPIGIAVAVVVYTEV